jgi:hypothetical protein
VHKIPALFSFHIIIIIIIIIDRPNRTDVIESKQREQATVCVREMENALALTIYKYAKIEIFLLFSFSRLSK